MFKYPLWLSGPFRRLKKRVIKLRSAGFLNFVIKSICSLFDSPNYAENLIFYKRVVLHPVKHYRRVVMAQEKLKDFRPVFEISKSEGFAFPEQNKFPALSALLGACNRILKKGYEKQMSQFSEGSNRKEFFFNILTPNEILENPELMNFCLSPEVTHTLMQYYGYVPRLCSMGIFISPPNDQQLKRSQLWHTDGTDLHHVKCFVNLSDVNSEDGPFSFLPANKTNDLRIQGNNLWKNPSDVAADFEEKHIKRLIGGPGSLAFADTSRCLHYGSRVTGKTRVVFQFHYAVYANYTNLSKDSLRDIRMQHYPEIRKRYAVNDLTAELLTLDEGPLEKAASRLLGMKNAGTGAEY